ncbi:MAG TPA: GNAT family N-acetyltransferase [Bacillota bacterium]|nr:GNAT family N-acetyltransferase [Bacillota bacterium]
MGVRLETRIYACEVEKMLEYWRIEPALQKHEEHCDWLEDIVFHSNNNPQHEVTEKLQNPPDFLFYMIYDGDQHVGFVEAFSRPFDFYGLSIDITSICVFKEFRGKGYVREALKLLIAQLFTLFPNARHISCQTSLDNQPMVRHLTELNFTRKDSTKVGEIFLYERDH